MSLISVLVRVALIVQTFLLCVIRRFKLKSFLKLSGSETKSQFEKQNEYTKPPNRLFLSALPAAGESSETINGQKKKRGRMTEN